MDHNADVEDLFGERSVYQTYLDVESALARAQARIGVIPQFAADTITTCAEIDKLSLENIYLGLRNTGHALVPVIWELDRVCGPEAGGYIHWGATTQNITQTGKLLIVKRCHRLLLRDIGRLLDILASVAEVARDYVMPGRTHGQHAVPVTFGYKVAVWIDEIIRHVERMKGCEGRVFSVMLGGGAGTLASVGIQGIETQDLMAEELGMASMTMPSRVIGDHLVEYISILAMFASTSTKIAREIYTLMKQEFGEVEEPIPQGRVGSSTMPQKRNPSKCQSIIAWGREVRMFVPMCLEAMQQEHEAEGSGDKSFGVAIDRTCILTSQILHALIDIFSGIKIFPDRMRKNLDLSGGLIMSEKVMLTLGDEMGRQKAHDVVYDAAQKSVNEGIAFEKALADEGEVAARLSPSQIEDLLNPETYTGLCGYFVDKFVDEARKESRVLA